MASTKLKQFGREFITDGKVVRVVLDGRITFVTVEQHGVCATGKSRCGRDDKYNADEGVKIAYVRALKRLMELAPRSSCVVIGQWHLGTWQAIADAFGVEVA